jgi:hypothetical protein
MRASPPPPDFRNRDRGRHEIDDDWPGSVNTMAIEQAHRVEAMQFLPIVSS